MTPTPKMAATGVAGAAAVVLVFLAKLVHIEMPADVAAAAVLVIAWVAGWFTSEAHKKDGAKHVAD